MSIEIELKFLVAQNAGGILAKWVDKFVSKNPDTLVEHSKVQLSNTYFDTEDQLFRQHDMGLRVRGTDGIFEQTIKTKGKVVGGLHQRPEFNVALEHEQLDLSLFDSQILPANFSVEQLQAKVEPLFTTEFSRQIWHIQHPSCVFEMVFDVGTISAQSESMPLAEVEVELKSGDISVVFGFARKLIKHLSKQQDDYDGSVRVGAFSKAARGYQLYFGKPLTVKSYMTQVPLKLDDSIEQAFVKTVEYGLNFMQYHEQCFCDSLDINALRRFNDGVAIIRHAFKQYTMLVSEQDLSELDQQLAWIGSSFEWVEHSLELEAIMSKTGKYRKRLELNTALAQLVADEGRKDPDRQQIERFFYQARYNQFLIDISRWLMEKGWRGDRDVNLNAQAQGSLQLLSCDMLNASWRSLLQAFPRQQQFSIEDYIEHQQQLEYSLLTGSCVGGLYSSSLRDGFRDPWVDISSGIDELKTLYLLQTLAKQVDTQGESTTLSWLQQQIDSLLHAMEQSRSQAIKMKPYWSAN